MSIMYFFPFTQTGLSRKWTLSVGIFKLITAEMLDPLTDKEFGPLWTVGTDTLEF